MIKHDTTYDPYFPVLTMKKIELTDQEIEELSQPTAIIEIIPSQPRCTCWYDNGVIDYE